MSPVLEPGSVTLLTRAAFLATAVLLTGLAFISAASPSSQLSYRLPRKRRASSIPFSLWLFEEPRYAFSGIINAFGPRGKNAPGVSPGSMIASPSRPGLRGQPCTNEPFSYFFNWTRDSGLCVRVVIDRLVRAQTGEEVGVAGESAQDLDTILKEFIGFNSRLQKLANLSGGLADGGLGEPKYLVDGTPFNESWGRPQNDGPAIRASTLIKYASHILNDRSSDASYVQSHIYSTKSPLILNYDLDYVTLNWKKPSYELWEEVHADNGGHFYTAMVSRRALRDGAAFARQLNDEANAKRYELVADEIDEALELFWNPSGDLGKEGGPDSCLSCVKPDGTTSTDQDDVLKSYLAKLPGHILTGPHILPTLHRLNGQPKPLQTDTAILLAINHAGTREETTWAPWGERCLSTLDRLVEIFSIVYEINHNRNILDGIAIGRYPEDLYDGVGQSVGHPWFLCTHAVAETLFLVADNLSHISSFTVTPVSHRFYQRFVPTILIGKVAKGSLEFETIGKGLRRWADGFLKVTQEYAHHTGEMSEQFHRCSGLMRGARELTWSYSSFCTAVDARAGHVVM